MHIFNYKKLIIKIYKKELKKFLNLYFLVVKNKCINKKGSMKF